MKKTIVIKGYQFSYEEEAITYDDNFSITEDAAKEILTLTKSLFDSKGIKFYLAYGSLLGAIRDNGLIKGDEDVDVYSFQEEAIVENLPYFYDKGLKVVRYSPGRFLTFRKNKDSYIDVYIARPLRRSIWSIYCYSLTQLNTPKKYFIGEKEIEFLGVKCFIPEKSEELIEFWYGKNWRTPVRGHKFYYEVKSAYYFHLIWNNHLKKYIKKMLGR